MTAACWTGSISAVGDEGGGESQCGVTEQTAGRSGSVAAQLKGGRQEEAVWVEGAGRLLGVDDCIPELALAVKGCLWQLLLAVVGCGMYHHVVLYYTTTTTTITVASACSLLCWCC